jgi:hypothetical protein
MRHLWTVLVLVAGAINLAPALGAVAPERMTAPYGVDLKDPNLQILMPHRAFHFGLVGGVLVLATRDPSPRTLGYAAGFGCAQPLPDEALRPAGSQRVPIYRRWRLA